MARPSKITPKKIAALRGARARGAGYREAAEEAGVGLATAHEWAKKDADRKNRSSGKRRSKVKPPPPPDESSNGAPTESVIAALVGGPMPSGLDDVRARLVLMRGLVERLIPAVEAEEFSPGSFVTISKYTDDLAELLERLTPPAPPDPDKDISVLESSRILMSRIAGMVSDAEQKAYR
jgi:hypothetical protein